jgi:tetratricopeptide (TPR) repeat protein
VAWHGFPDSDLDRFLESMVSGKYDSPEAKKLREADKAISQYKTMVMKSDQKAGDFAETILTNNLSEWRVPHRLARTILTDPAIRSRDLPLALRASSKAVEMTKERSFDALEIKARALFASGKKQEAIETQKKAMSLCNDEGRTAEMKKFLALYEKGSLGN